MVALGVFLLSFMVIFNTANVDTEKMAWSPPLRLQGMLKMWILEVGPAWLCTSAHSVLSGIITPVDVEVGYTEAVSTRSDINEHVPVLRAYAVNVSSVIEFGVRTGVSSWGFLAGLVEAARESPRTEFSLMGVDMQSMDSAEAYVKGRMGIESVPNVKVGAEDDGMCVCVCCAMFAPLVCAGLIPESV